MLLEIVFCVFSPLHVSDIHGIESTGSLTFKFRFCACHVRLSTANPLSGERFYTGKQQTSLA